MQYILSQNGSSGTTTDSDCKIQKSEHEHEHEHVIDVNELSQGQGQGLSAIVMCAVANCDLGVELLINVGNADIDVKQSLGLNGNLTLLHILAENCLVKSITAILLKYPKLTAIMANIRGTAITGIDTETAIIIGNTPIELAAMTSCTSNSHVKDMAIEVISLLLDVTTDFTSIHINTTSGGIGNGSGNGNGNGSGVSLNDVVAAGPNLLKTWQNHSKKQSQAQATASAASAAAGSGDGSGSGSGSGSTVFLRSTRVLEDYTKDARNNSKSNSNSTSNSNNTTDIDTVTETNDFKLANEYKKKGNQYYKDKKYEDALNSYSLAIQLHGCDETFWSNRSVVYLALNLPSEALADAEICRSLKPDWPKGCYRLGAARMACGLYEDAAVAAFEGIKLDNNNMDLKRLTQEAVKKGKEEYQRKQQQQQQQQQQQLK